MAFRIACSIGFMPWVSCTCSEVRCKTRSENPWQNTKAGPSWVAGAGLSLLRAHHSCKDTLHVPLHPCCHSLNIVGRLVVTV